jgi:hypothetical protein
LQQILFKKRRQWSRSRGQFTHGTFRLCTVYGWPPHLWSQFESLRVG